MRISDFGIGAVFVMAGIVAGWGFAVNPRAARVCFWLSGSAFGSLGVIWSVTNPNYPMTTRLFIAGCIGAVAAVGLAWALAQVPLQEPKEKTEAASSAPHQSITMFKTRGGELSRNKLTVGPVKGFDSFAMVDSDHTKVTDNDFSVKEIISEGRPSIRTEGSISYFPKERVSVGPFKISLGDRTKSDDGSYKETSYLFNEGDFHPKLLRLEIKAKTLIDADLLLSSKSGYKRYPSKTKDGVAVFEIANFAHEPDMYHMNMSFKEKDDPWSLTFHVLEP